APLCAKNKSAADCRRYSVMDPLKALEKEKLVLQDRPAHRAAIDVAMRGRFFGAGQISKITLGIENVISSEPVGIAVKSIRSVLGLDQHDGARPPAKLRRKTVAQYLKFFDRADVDPLALLV